MYDLIEKLKYLQHSLIFTGAVLWLHVSAGTQKWLEGHHRKQIQICLSKFGDILYEIDIYHKAVSKIIYPIPQ